MTRRFILVEFSRIFRKVLFFIQSLLKGSFYCLLSLITFRIYLFFPIHPFLYDFSVIIVDLLFFFLNQAQINSFDLQKSLIISL